jgi:arsenate reductase
LIFYILFATKTVSNSKPEETRLPNILFVCAGNAVRSQMAEGWARHLGDSQINVRSAGISPFGVHPMAIAAMKSAGVDISAHRNRRVDDRQLAWADYVITLCDTVKPYSAYFPEKIVYDHWSIPNPDALVTDEISPEEAYAQVRDQLRERIENFLATIQNK